MTLASDQNTDAKDLSYLSQRMLELREVVLQKWEKKVRATVKGAASLPHPILINTIPALYDNIAEALTPSYPRNSAAVATPSVTTEHGGERARLTQYETDALISEYQILRTTIVNVLVENQVPIDAKEMQIINSSIDVCIQEAVTAFTLAHTVFREQFFATIVHDLRNPLSAASVAAQLILQTRDLEKIDRAATNIVKNLGRMDQMIRDLIDTIMLQQGGRLSLRPTNFDIAKLVKEVCEQATAQHGSRFEMEGTSITGWWSWETLGRALENMIDNAIKYGEPGTPIRITFQEYHERILLSVHNQGDPIPSDQIETIFQVFRRAKAAKQGNQQGWGIGLPYVRSVAESHGGSIDVDSSEERGTTFSIDIPLDSRPFQNAPTLT